MRRIGLLAVVMCSALVVQGVSAQEGTPFDAAPELCNPPHDRLVSLALKDEGLFVAVVSPQSMWTYDEGVLLTVHTFLEDPPQDSRLASGDVIRADVGPIAVCFPQRAYTREGSGTFAELVVVVVRAHSDGTFMTRSGYRVLDPEGAPVLASAIASDSATISELSVELYDKRVITIDALMEDGRIFVEPTATPWPEGIPTIDPILVGPDSGVVGGGPDVEGLPATGGESGEGKPWAPYVAGIAAVALVFAGGVALRLRRR